MNTSALKTFAPAVRRQRNGKACTAQCWSFLSDAFQSIKTRYWNAD
jgi:hypothetical protein